MISLLHACASIEIGNEAPRPRVWSCECPLNRGEEPPDHECIYGCQICPSCTYVGTWDGRLMVECETEEETR